MSFDLRDLRDAYREVANPPRRVAVVEIKDMVRGWASESEVERAIALAVETDPRFYVWGDTEIWYTD